MRVLHTTAFPPRGGSAQVVRYLTTALIARGEDVLVVSGSLGGEYTMGNASAFYEGVPLFEVDHTEASEGHLGGIDPMSRQFASPLSPSYEDRPGAADRAFYRVGAAGLEHLTRSWCDVLAVTTESLGPDVLHLHHLHHVHLAAMELSALRRIPKLAHLHGTELKMLKRMRELKDDPTLHVAVWDSALARAAAGMDHFVVISDAVASEAHDLLGARHDQITVIPNGVDTALFRHRQYSADEKIRRLRRLLIEAPRGWDESGIEGSIRYTEADLGNFMDRSGTLKPLLIYAGRFLAFKRVDLLLAAVSDLVRTGEMGQDFNLLICGGAPGEWEGEHPYTLAKRLSLTNVFFCGWLGHDELAQALNLADVFVAPSSNEPFGQVYLEAMATSLPVVATRSGGPESFVVDGGRDANGWLCAPDDVESLAGALNAALADAGERARRGANGRALARDTYAWGKVAGQFVELYEQLRRASAAPSALPD
jgi:glycosyltransferase involved in cell wall biosynthesis